MSPYIAPGALGVPAVPGGPPQRPGVASPDAVALPRTVSIDLTPLVESMLTRRAAPDPAADEAR